MHRRGTRSSRSLWRSPRMSASRRRFLQLSTAALSGAVLTNCARNLADVGSSGGEAAASADTLHVYSWSAYIDEDLLKQFEQETGIRVIADIYDSNETMLARMQAGGGQQYSVIYPSDYMVETMKELDLLLPLDGDRLPKTADLLEQWQDPPYDPGNEMSFPYAWGTTGLIYNAAELGEIEDWDYLWDNQRQLSRRMTLLNDVREVMGMALKSLGYSNSTQDPDEIEAAYELLAELKPDLNSFTTDGWRDQIIVGDLLVAHAYSVDGIDAMQENPDLQYVVPASGATVWTDAVVIPKSAPNVDAAYAWLNYILAADTSAPIVSRLRLATPNKQAFELMPDELKSDETLFPPDEVLAKCEVLATVGDAAEIYDRYWTQLNS
ncbi:ABC transporter substrate-binding protein [Leptolyngbya sp. AN02str]|uniref:ABC transporter substrate-binding protein n=1 Tax=Leptolyngbya sp. AN02str TaxID=3423363 RepID=UPI003D313C11